jgi:hypothetical protein
VQQNTDLTPQHQEKKQHPAQYSKIQDELFPENLRNKIGKL